MPFGQVAALVSAGLVLFGSLFVVLGARTLAGDRRRRRTWHPYRGRVVAKRLDDGQVRCQVAYVRDGTTVLFWNRFTSSMLSDPVGREVGVLVNPEDRHDAVVSSGLVGGSLVGVVFVVLGGLVAVGGLVTAAVTLLVLRHLP